MTSFDFTSTAQCERCGNYLSSSTEECDECKPSDLRRYRFERIVGGEEVQVVWAVNGERAWYELAEVVDDPVPWKCRETGKTSVDIGINGIDVRELSDE